MSILDFIRFKVFNWELINWKSVSPYPRLCYIFWWKFDKANHSVLQHFHLGGNRFSKNSDRSFDWGTGALVKMHRLNAFSRNVNTINQKKNSYTWWNILVRENSTSILETDKILTTLKKWGETFCSLLVTFCSSLVTFC